MPAFFKIWMPLPDTRWSGSIAAMTTLLMPAFIKLLTQGGVLPVWAHGSKVT